MGGGKSVGGAGPCADGAVQRRETPYPCWARCVAVVQAWGVAVLVVAAVLLSGCSGGSPGSTDALDPGPPGSPPAGASTSGGGSSASSAPTKAPDPIVTDVGKGKGAINGVVATEAVVPIAGAAVVVQPINVTVLTDSEGRFVLEGLEPGAYVVNVTHQDYKPRQATAQVTSGRPLELRLTLEPSRNLDPHVVQDSEQILVSSSFCVATYCNHVFSGNSQQLPTHDVAYFEVNDQPTTLQAEVAWDATVAMLGEVGQLTCTILGDDPDGSSALVRYSQSGTSPLTLRMPGTWVDEDSGAPVLANGGSCQLSNANGAQVPASLMVNQQADLYLHLFYNFVPDEGWTFIADGEYPVPP